MVVNIFVLTATGRLEKYKSKIMKAGKESIKIMKKKALKEFKSKNYNHAEWFFGSNVKKIPKWTGYTIGFKLVGEYLKKHHDKKPSQLFAAKSEKFVE